MRKERTNTSMPNTKHHPQQQQHQQLTHQVNGSKAKGRKLRKRNVKFNEETSLSLSLSPSQSQSPSRSSSSSCSSPGLARKRSMMMRKGMTTTESATALIVGTAAETSTTLTAITTEASCCATLPRAAVLAATTTTRTKTTAGCFRASGSQEEGNSHRDRGKALNVDDDKAATVRAAMIPTATTTISELTTRAHGDKGRKEGEERSTKYNDQIEGGELKIESGNDGDSGEEERKGGRGDAKSNHRKQQVVGFPSADQRQQFHHHPLKPKVPRGSGTQSTVTATATKTKKQNKRPVIRPAPAPKVPTPSPLSPSSSILPAAATIPSSALVASLPAHHHLQHPSQIHHLSAPIGFGVGVGVGVLSPGDAIISDGGNYVAGSPSAVQIIPITAGTITTKPFAAFSAMPTTTTLLLSAPPPPPPSLQSPTTLHQANFFDGYYERDEIDMQQSDSDEDGYSDIDFDDDDEIIEDDEDVTDLYDPPWTDMANVPRLIFKFNTPSTEIGISRPRSSERCSFYFAKLLGPHFYALLSDCCNQRARELVERGQIVGTMFLKMVTKQEVRIFLGLCLQMSSMKLPKLTDYWPDHELGQPSKPPPSSTSCHGFRGFGDKMSLERFQFFLQVMNFDLFDGQPPELSPSPLPPSPLSRVQPLLDFFNRRMLEEYTCGQRLVLNRPIIFWKGKFQWLHELTEKFRHQALTLHFLSESSGLLLKIFAEVEWDAKRPQTKSPKSQTMQRVAIALDILKEQLGCGRTVYVSKYYGSYALGYELAQLQTYCTGYLDRKCYGNSKQLILTNLKENSFATKYAGAIMMAKWRKRSKSLYFYSSDCLAIYAKETTRTHSDPRPKVIKELDWQLKSPGNLNDINATEFMMYYQLGLEQSNKQVKWDIQLIVYILNLFVLNAYVLYVTYANVERNRVYPVYPQDTTNLKRYSQFHQEVIAMLLKTSEDVKKNETPAACPPRVGGDSTATDEDAAAAAANAPDRSRNPTEDQHQFLNTVHMPMMIPRRHGKILKKKCRICRKGGINTFSKICCEICPGMPGLCEEPCFQIWHDQLKKSLEAGKQIKTRIFGTSEEKSIYF